MAAPLYLARTIPLEETEHNPLFAAFRGRRLHGHRGHRQNSS
jgi:hypothetical protein